MSDQKCGGEEDVEATDADRDELGCKVDVLVFTAETVLQACVVVSTLEIFLTKEVEYD